jgi:quinol monooxygenase YgiN
MPEPIIFIAHQKIKQGKTEQYKEYYQEVAEWIEANKPQTAAHIAYVSEDGTEASIIHIFPDAEAMENHMQNLGDLGKKAFTVMEIAGSVLWNPQQDGSGFHVENDSRSESEYEASARGRIGDVGWESTAC